MNKNNDKTWFELSKTVKPLRKKGETVLKLTKIKNVPKLKSQNHMQQNSNETDNLFNAVLDMHGLTEDEAYLQLDRFIAKAHEHNYSQVLIITGRGKNDDGVLKLMTPRWINEPKFRSKILGFAYASPNKGGCGALEVKLKKH